jgi:hypothetical protein
MEGYDDLNDCSNAAARPRDAAIDQAVARLKAFFDESPARLFYSTQIETAFEREYFHWITGKALLELAERGIVKRVSTPLANFQKTINFYGNRRYRYVQRELKSMLALLSRMFDPEFTHAIGRHGELMFDAALGRHGFRAEGLDTRQWQGKAWTESNHNLDRIVTRDGITYGVEIKNTQNYIPRDELRTKLNICKHLGVRPLFIMRFAPKSYMHEINKSGGFGLLFEEQMYPWGHGSLLSEVQDRLGLKVHCPRDVKDGDMHRLIKWHERNVGGGALSHLYSEGS